jgi:hypothetical protein
MTTHILNKKGPRGPFSFSGQPPPAKIAVMKIRPPRVRRPKKAKAASKSDSNAFKVKIRGKDNTPLSMADLQQGLYETARKLKPFEEKYRIKWATLFLTVIDENGNEVRLNDKGEWVIYPYKSAADEHGA